jgi:hypothetical protein
LRSIARLSKFGRQEAKFAGDALAGNEADDFLRRKLTPCVLLLFCTVNLPSKTPKSNAQIFACHYAVVSQNLTTNLTSMD